MGLERPMTEAFFTVLLPVSDMTTNKPIDWMLRANIKDAPVRLKLTIYVFNKVRLKFFRSLETWNL